MTSSRGSLPVFFAFLVQEHFHVGFFPREFLNHPCGFLSALYFAERDQEKDDQKYDGNQVEHKMFHVQMPFMVAGKEGTGRSRPGVPRP